MKLSRLKNESEIQDKLLLNRINDDFTSFYDLQISQYSKYNDDFWDLSDYNEEFQFAEFFKYDFSQIDYVYKNYLKISILNSWFLKEVAFSTLKSLFNEITMFINYLAKKRYYYYELIDESCILGFFAEREISVNHEISLKHSIKVLLMEIECRNNNVSFSNCYKVLEYYDKGRYKVEKEEGKHKLIPAIIYNKIISLAMKDILNEQLEHVDRMSACMLVIIAETGMRIGEFSVLRTKNLKSYKFDEENVEFSYINFITFKTTQTKFKRTKSFMTEKAVLAFKTLIRLLDGFRDSDNFLYANIKSGSKYVGQTSHKRHLYRFFYRHQEELGFDKLTENELSKFHIWNPNKEDIKSISILPKNCKTYYYVTFHQFRVYVATSLYNQGYHLDWIREHMNHLVDTMTEHYIRVQEYKDNKQDNAVEMLLNRVNGEGTALETDLSKVEDKQIKDELKTEKYLQAYENINKFLKKKKLNLFSDIKQIVSMLQRTETPILDAELGVCAKSFNKLCERHQYLSSRSDTYNIGVYVPDFVNVDYTYKVFKEKEAIIMHNKSLCEENEKYFSEYTREIKSMKHYVKKRLYPELLLLDKEIEDSGKSTVVNNHTNLKEVIDSIPNIKEEVNTWKKVF
jgi:integrase